MKDYIEYNDNYDRGSYARSTQPSYAESDTAAYGNNATVGTSIFSGVMTRVYTWMAAALVLTAGTAWAVANSPAILQLIYGNQAVVWVLLLAEFGLVMGISWGINRLSPSMATALFLLYSVVNGVTLSSIFFAYSIGTIYQAFAASALTFGAMSIVGHTIKRDLSGLGGIMIMALIGLIIASVVNLFWSNAVLDSIITYVGVFLFVGITAYDTQRIKAMCVAAEQYGDAAAPRRVAIMGALSLYLDFINLFLYLLRLFGRSRD